MPATLILQLETTCNSPYADEEQVKLPPIVTVEVLISHWSTAEVAILPELKVKFPVQFNVPPLIVIKFFLVAKVPPLMVILPAFKVPDPIASVFVTPVVVCALSITAPLTVKTSPAPMVNVVAVAVVFKVRLAHASVVVFTETFAPEAMITLSPAAGTTPVAHVVVLSQGPPVAVDVIVAAFEIIIVHKNIANVAIHFCIVLDFVFDVISIVCELQF